jgi:hypothetical protein
VIPPSIKGYEDVFRCFAAGPMLSVNRHDSGFSGAVKEHTTFAITDIQRMQDFRFKQIAIGSISEAWQWAKH